MCRGRQRQRRRSRADPSGVRRSTRRSGPSPAPAESTPFASRVWRAIFQSKALRRTVGSVVRRSIDAAAMSTSAANVIAYSVMRTRSASTRKSGRSSGQGSRLGCVDFLLTVAHATRKNRARHTTVLLIRGILVAVGPMWPRSRDVVGVPTPRTSERPTTRWKPALIPSRPRRGDLSNGCSRSAMRNSHSRTRDRRDRWSDPRRPENTPRATIDRPRYYGRPPSGWGELCRRFARNPRHVVKSSMNMPVSTAVVPGTLSAALRMPVG